MRFNIFVVIPDSIRYPAAKASFYLCRNTGPDPEEWHKDVPFTDLRMESSNEGTSLKKYKNVEMNFPSMKLDSIVMFLNSANRLTGSRRYASKEC